jgi:hypothetical protein
MKAIYFMAGDSDAWVTVVVFVIIGISALVNLIKKAMQNVQKQDGKGEPVKPRNRFLDLIDEVRRMAEQEGGGKSQMPGQQPPIIRIETMRQKQTFISPKVPQLKPIGEVKKPTMPPQPQFETAVKPYYSEETVLQRVIPDEEDEMMDEETEAMEEFERTIKSRENALKTREEALRKAEKRLSELQSSIENRSISPETREKEEAGRPAEFQALKDYLGVFESPELLKEAIVLREILGQPRAITRHRTFNR